MPVPTPLKEESQKGFISRCMSDKVMLKEFEANDQRYAVCNNSWEKSHLEQNSSAESIDLSNSINKAKIISANEDSISIQEAVLINALQMQQQFRVFRWQGETSKDFKAFSPAYSVLDSSIDLFLESYIPKYGVNSNPELEIEIQNYVNKLSCSIIATAYIEFLIDMAPLSLSDDDNDLKLKIDKVISALNQLKYLYLIS